MKVRDTWKETLLWLLGAVLLGLICGQLLVQSDNTVGRIWFSGDPWATKLEKNHYKY